MESLYTRESRMEEEYIGFLRLRIQLSEDGIKSGLFFVTLVVS